MGKMIRAINTFQVGHKIAVIVERTFLEEFMSSIEYVDADFDLMGIDFDLEWGKELEDSDTEICAFLGSHGLLYSGGEYRIAYYDPSDSMRIVDYVKEQKALIFKVAVHYGIDTDILAYQPLEAELLE